MNSKKLSHVSLIAGLVLGVTALWAAASPLGASGDLATGGWVGCSAYDNGWHTVAGTSGDCDPCQGTLSRYCFEYAWGTCTGGSITVVMAIYGQPGATPHSAGYIPCGGDCTSIYEGDCY